MVSEVTEVKYLAWKVMDDERYLGRVITGEAVSPATDKRALCSVGLSALSTSTNCC